jgi:DNA-binding beta-propeller fold protein YncE
MSKYISRRRFLGATAGAGLAGVAGCLTTTDEGYEIWALDQGTDTIYVYEAHSEPNEDAVEFDQVGDVDLGDEPLDIEGPFSPHTVRFNAAYAYAVVTCPGTDRILVYRAGDRELITAIETGPGTHFATFTPETEDIVVDVLGEQKLVHISTDFTERVFEVENEVVLTDAVGEIGENDGGPLYHTHTQEGRSLHTLGPDIEAGGVVALDYDEFTVEAVGLGDELPANGRILPHPRGQEVYLTAGAPATDAGADGVGEYYVLDTEADEVHTQASTGGIDPSSAWFAPDGEELWVLNRGTNDGIVVDPETDEVVGEIAEVGPATADSEDERDAPENCWFSPDGRFVFATLAGPVAPRSDSHTGTGVTPGIAVLNAETRERLEVLEPDPLSEYSETDIENARARRAGELADDAEAPQLPDFHGLGVRPVADFEGENAPPY